MYPSKKFLHSRTSVRHSFARMKRHVAPPRTVIALNSLCILAFPAFTSSSRGGPIDLSARLCVASTQTAALAFLRVSRQAHKFVNVTHLDNPRVANFDLRTHFLYLGYLIFRNIELLFNLRIFFLVDKKLTTEVLDNNCFNKTQCFFFNYVTRKIV